MTHRRTLRRFAALAVAYSTSTFGNFLNLIALNLYTYHLTGSAVQTGILMALKLTAGFLAGPVAGVLTTRYSRRLVMVVSDLAQAVAMLALVLTPASFHLPLLYGVAAVLGAGNTLFLVALRSSVPEMVGADHRARANGYLVTGKAIGMVAGFASAGAVIGWLGFGSAFGLNAASFVVSALVVAWLPLRFRSAGVADPASRQPGHPLRFARVLYGVAPVLVAMLALRGLDAFGSASHNVAFPVYAGVVSPGNAAWFLSQFWVCWGVGSLAASRLTPRWLGRSSTSVAERAFAVAVCVMSAGFVAAFLGLPLPLLAVAAVVAGLADGCTEIVYTSRLQATRDDLRGAVFGLSATTETFGFAAGMLASSVMLEALPVPPVVAGFHGLAVLGAVAFLVLRRARRDSAGGQPAPVHDTATR
ncbi:MAG: MFS transporter [Micromonosporaceae bacterium]|nr:MFS transporter [Micromonosporaceae bacterium]